VAMPTDATEAERNFVQNLKSARIASGRSQEQLAAAMSKRGFKWHQATVYKVESGDRPVKLAEAAALAEIVDQRIDELTATPESAHADRYVRRALKGLDNTLEQLIKHADLFRFLQLELEHVMSLPPAGEVDPEVLAIGRRYLKIDPQAVVSAGVQNASERFRNGDDAAVSIERSSEADILSGEALARRGLSETNAS
jgi:transcriptional regulator with XRE-family HTH domain